MATTFVTADHNLGHITQLLDRFIKESAYKREVKPDGVAKYLANPNVLTVVAYRDDEPVGISMAAIWEPSMFTGKAATEMVLYVVPEHRGGSIAVRLIKMVEEWAREQGADGLMLSQSTLIGEIDRVRRFYEKLGFTVTGFSTMKEF